MSENSMNQRSTTCCNCKSEFKDESLTTIFIDVEDKCKEINACQVWDAIAYIYGTSWHEFQSYLLKNNDLLYSANITAESIAICRSCISLLLKNYKAHKQFQSSTNPLSIVEKVKNSRQSKILSLSSSFEHDFFNASETEDVEDVKPLIHNPEVFKEETVEYSEPENEMYDHQPTFEEDNIENTSVWNNLEKVSTEQPQNGKEDRSADTININSTKTPNNNIVSKQKRSDNSKLKGSNGKASTTRLKNTQSSKKTITFKKKISKAKASQSRKIQRRKIVEKKEGKEKFQCDICEKLCPTLKYLQNTHMPIHIEEKSCHICSKKLSSAKNLRIHIKFVHKKGSKEDLEVPCQVCGKLYTTAGLYHHMKVHGERVEYKCDDCGRVYLSKLSFDDHVRSHNDNFVPYKCQHCGKSFKLRRTLEAHKKLHTAEKNFVCDQCPARFHLKTRLHSHKLVHTEERPFICSKCGKAFKSQHILNVHMKLHKEIEEKGEYSSKCEACGSVFKSSNGLRNHRRQNHTHKVTYQCSFCGKRLSKPTVLANHEELHRSNPDYQPRKVQMWKQPPFSRTSSNIPKSVG